MPEVGMLATILRTLRAAEEPLCAETLSGEMQTDRQGMAAMLEELERMGLVQSISEAGACELCQLKSICGLPPARGPFYRPVGTISD